MFHPIITIPKTAKSQSYKSWNGEKPRHQYTSKPLQDQVSKYSGLVSQSKEDNRIYHETIAAFNSITTDPNAKTDL